MYTCTFCKFIQCHNISKICSFIKQTNKQTNKTLQVKIILSVSSKPTSCNCLKVSIWDLSKYFTSKMPLGAELSSYSTYKITSWYWNAATNPFMSKSLLTLPLLSTKLCSIAKIFYYRKYLYIKQRKALMKTWATSLESRIVCIVECTHISMHISEEYKCDFFVTIVDFVCIFMQMKNFIY